MPRSASTFVTVPPPAPEPTTTTSWTAWLAAICAMEVSYCFPATRFLPPAQLSAVSCRFSLFTVHFSLFTVHFRLGIIYRSPPRARLSAHDHRPATGIMPRMSDAEFTEVAFPKLTPEQIRAISMCSCTERQTFQPGEALFQIGDRDFAMFIVESGKVEVLDLSGDTPRVLRVHEEREFTGDVSHLTGRPAIVTGVALTTTTAFAVPHDAVRELLNVSP